MLKRTAGMVLISVWAMTSVGVVQVPTSVLLNNVREPANQVSREMTYEEAMSGKITVLWPSGEVSDLGPLEAGQRYKVVEGKGVDSKSVLGTTR